MDSRDVVEQKGYRLQDLTPEYQMYIQGMRKLLEDFQLYYVFDDNEEDEIIDKLKEQIATEVIEDIYGWLESVIYEYWIGAADAEAL